MSPEELATKRQELIASQAAIARELAALDAQAIEDERKRQLNMELVIEVTEIANGHVRLKHEFNDVLLGVMHKIPSRWWDSVAKEDDISVEHWEEAQRRIAAALPNAKFKYTNGTQEAIHAELEKPDYSVTLSADSKFLMVAVGRADSLIIQRLPGARYNEKKAAWSVPVTEGWRLYERLQPLVKVLWADSAIAIIKHDIEQRTKLDEIALRNESSL